MAPRSRIVVAVVAASVVVGGGAAVALGPGGDTATPAVAQDRPTVEVERGDLRSTEQVTGDLGHGRARTVTGVDGIVTWLPAAGREVGRGGDLLRVDDAPVSVLFGDLPLWRTLEVPAAPKANQPWEPPMTGRDVDLVAANLAALGLWGGATEGVAYDASLAAAVEDWRGSAVIGPGDVVVTRGPVRVASVTAQVGAEAGGELLTVTGTARVLSLDVPTQLAAQLAVGDPVRVVLADGRRVRTSVTTIGGESAEGDDGGPPTSAVTVTARRPAALAEAPLGPVTADVVTAARTDVLQVPITALLALAEGGYALERPDGTLVPVELGLVAGGRAEVRGAEPGIAAGETVVVAG